MSTVDDKANEVSKAATNEDVPPAPDESGETVVDTPPPVYEGKIKEPAGKFFGPIILFFLLGFGVSLVVGWIVFPKEPAVPWA